MRNDQVRQLTFVDPMPGFADDVGFTLSPIDPAGVLRSLRSVRDPELRFVLTPAGVFFADYQASVTAAFAGALQGALADALGAAEFELFVMLTVGDGLADTTANLRAPIAVDPESGRAVQVILDDDTLPMRHPLPAR